jgi:hypothetical protein
MISVGYCFTIVAEFRQKVPQLFCQSFGRLEMPMVCNQSFTGAPVAELVDAVDSKSTDRQVLGVRFSPGAPILSQLTAKPSIHETHLAEF